jgi:hypothetical protein
MGLGLRMHGESDAVTAVLREADALDRELACDAELGISEIATPAWVLGALQRGHGAPMGALVRRVSGGALVHAQPGTLHVVLALRTPSALVPCDARRLVNRYVRPLLRALTKGGATAHYFGRDWVSVGHRPVAAVGFAHDAGTGRAAFEAFVAVRGPFSVARPSFLGKEPGTLEDVAQRTFDASSLARLIADAYLALAGGEARELPARDVDSPAGREDALRVEPPWTVSVEEVIGPVSAGRDTAGVLRLGGDFMASRDAVARVETQVAALGNDGSAEAMGAIVDEAFAPPAVIEGVKDLRSLRSALLGALAQNRT